MIGFLHDENKSPKRCFRYELSWDRFIYIDSNIDDALVQRLAPDILRLKQQSNEPITVGIDSAGGSLSSFASLLGLLESPNLDGQSPPIYTVAINRAQSAAAALLAFGKYSVAFQHSQILCHPVSLPISGILNATSAIAAARDLQVQDEDLAFKLAERILERVTWVYNDHKLRGLFDKAEQSCPVIANRFNSVFKEILTLYGCSELDVYDFDLAGFALVLWAELSFPVDRDVINQAVEDLLDVVQSQVLLSYLQQGVISLNNSDLPSQSSLRGELHSAFEASQKLLIRLNSKDKDAKPPSEEKINELERLVAIYFRHAIDDEGRLNISRLLPELTKETELLRLLSQSSNHPSVRWLMENKLGIFLPQEAIDRYNISSQEEKSVICQTFLKPQCELFWLFTVMFCRRLFALENNLTPIDAQLLGLVDDILGGGFVLGPGVLEHLPEQPGHETESSEDKSSEQS